MALIDRIETKRARSWPVGKGETSATGLGRYGYQDPYEPAEATANLLATSNEVFSAVNLRARLMSSLELNLYRGKGSRKKLANNSRAGQVLDFVNPFWTPRRLARMDELSMCLWGESFWALEPGRLGEPENIWWLKASQVRPIVHSTDYISGFAYQPNGGGAPIVFQPSEIVWFRYPNPLDQFGALSPASAARLAAETGSQMMKSNHALFSNGLSLGGLIVPESGKVSFSSEQAQELERDLERRWSNQDRKHRWAVLRYEAQFRPMDVTPKDAEFVSGLDLTLRQVCNAYGIPAPLLNDLAHATLANVSEFERILWQNTLVPDARLKSDEISEQFLPRFSDRTDHAEFDFTLVEALQEAAAAVWGREAQAIDRGAITINEWREAKGMPAVTWGDVPWMAVNKAPLDPETGMLASPEPTVTPPEDQPVLDPKAPPKSPRLDEHGRRMILAAFAHSDDAEVPRRSRPVF